MFRHLLLLVLTVCALILAQQITALSSCSAALIKGRYAYSAHGTQPLNGTSVGRIGIGSAIFDGIGTLSGWSIGKTNLTLTNQTFSGNYSVNSTNCLVTFDLFLGTTQVPTVAGWIGAAGEIFTVQNGTLTAKTWEFFPAPKTCLANSVKGTYVWDSIGTGADGTPFAFSASETFDGKSAITGYRWVVPDGLVLQNGSYTVNTVCQIAWSNGSFVGTVFKSGFVYINLASGVSEIATVYAST